MAHPLPTHLRAQRKRLGLTQREIAELLGMVHCGSAGRLERYARRPNVETVLRLQLIYGYRVEELWPGVARDQERALLQTVRARMRALARNNTDGDSAKIATLRVIEARCITGLSSRL